MNRRRFVVAGAASLTLLGQRAAAQRSSADTTVLVSELTGAEIDFTESGFTLEHQELGIVFGADAAAYDHEHIHFLTANGKLEIDFIYTGGVDWQGEMADFIDGYKEEFAAQELVYADMADGGYAAISFEADAMYYEYQLGAFPNFDMRVVFTTSQDSFKDEFVQAQSVMVGGAAPCLFTVESKVEDLVFAGAAQTTTTPSNARTTRGSVNTSQTSGTSTSNTSQTSNTSTTTTSNTGSTGSESEYVDMIIAHREEFLTSYDLFMGHLSVLAEDTTTDAEKSDLFAQMYDIALVWKTYPDDAMAPAVPSSLTELSTLYVQWALVVGDMGTLFEEIYNGSDATDAFIGAVTEWELLDAELQVALEGRGFQSYTRASGAIRSIRSGLKAAWRSVH